MMSLSQIAEESRKQAKKAARLHKQPYLFEEEDRNCFPPFPFPNIGDYRPKGWELINQYFCDKLGFETSERGELTYKQLIQALKPGYGYAIIEEGEFQLYIGEFKKL
jgi:hypothetical protein